MRARTRSTIHQLTVPRLAIAMVTCMACSDGSSAKPGKGDAGGDPDPFATGTELRFDVPERGRVFVRLNAPGVVNVAGDPRASGEWDLAFEGFEVFTNSGPSGAGKGGAFGPLEAASYNENPPPAIPRITADTTGGAFLRWYAYDGEAHKLYSRFHVLGIQDGARRWKVQVQTYYGERQGAPISALYRIRAAELFADRAGNAVEIADLDGTAGDASADPSTPSECLDLGTGARTMLTPAAARTSPAWHLCFRRDAISVNGELGGPRGVGAIDFDGAKTAGETLQQVMTRTEAGEKARFDAITYASFESKNPRGDRIVSAFGDTWLDPASATRTPAPGAWVVSSASGAQKYFLGFTGFEHATAKSPGTVVVRIKPFKG
ncbi:HmuY family protein [Pendulispora albinea]|uniref:HmuY family protein n=1 Tax=Pendulispora albinea TaxID=2741071 RepID=A0ABZ2M0W0_9BACT